MIIATPRQNIYWVRAAVPLSLPLVAALIRSAHDWSILIEFKNYSHNMWRNLYKINFMINSRLTLLFETIKTTLFPGHQLVRVILVPDLIDKDGDLHELASMN